MQLTKIYRLKSNFHLVKTSINKSFIEYSRRLKNPILNSFIKRKQTSNFHNIYYNFNSNKFSMAESSLTKIQPNNSQSENQTWQTIYKNIEDWVQAHEKKHKNAKKRKIIPSKRFLNTIQIQSKLNQSNINNALGSMFGAFQGDALGAYCEFEKQISNERLDKVMQMDGGGTFSIKAAQFTDDSQLASHMLQGLCTYDPIKKFEEQQFSILYKISNEYVKWARSQPFDMGITTRKAITAIYSVLSQQKPKQDESDLKENQKQERLKSMWQKISDVNSKSESNGSLMKITPMAVFVSLMIVNGKAQHCNQFKTFIKNQVNMIHGHKAIQECCYAWVQLLVEIILRDINNKSLSVIYNDWMNRYRDNPELKQWINDIENNVEINAKKLCGWTKIAFSLGINQLRKIVEQPKKAFGTEQYRNSLREVIGLAGDTDTNAAIVGGLIGAVLGFKKLPSEY